MKILFTKRPNQKLSYDYEWKKLLWSTSWFRYKTIWIYQKINNRKVEDYTTGCLLHYEYTRNHYRLIALDLSRKKELDDDPKAILQIEFVGPLKKLDADGNTTDAASSGQSLFFLTILEKIKKTRF